MREMKDSGIKWIGNVPSNWKLSKIKYMTTQRECVGKYSPEKDKFIGLENVIGFADRYIETSTEYEVSIYDVCHKGDILFGRLRPYLAKILTVPFDGYCTGEFLVFDSFDGCKNYLKYVLLSKPFIDEVNLSTYGAKMPRANADFILNMYLPLPKIGEQEKIAGFLDSQCSEIDAISADIQKEIETLEQYKRSIITEAVTKGLNPNVEMKDSGVQWIGKMPANWTCIKGKYILKYMQKPVKPDDGVITCFRDGEVTLRSNRREDGFTMADKEIGYQGIDVGDLVVHGMDGFAGAIGISDSRGKASPVLNVLDSRQDKKYIMYYLRSMAYGDVFTALATGIRVRSCDLRWNKLSELLYPVPPLEEQAEIVKYIGDTLNKANAVISEKKQQLEVLDSYKKSLIYEYVTGKKEVL